MPAPRIRAAYSKVSVKSRTVLPMEARERLSVGPGDRLRDLLTPDGVRIETAPPESDDLLVTFTDWAGTHDEGDHADL